MKRKSLLSGLLVLCVVVCTAAILDLSGKWKGTLHLPGRDMPLAYNFKVDGEKLTGTVEGPDGTVDIDKGTIKDNQLEFDVTIPSGDIIHHTGKYYVDSTTVDLLINDQKFHVKLLRVQ
jgi:hypothetical protein